MNCCELLSKTCIFALWNNIAPRPPIIFTVVNCFQKLVSLLFETTCRRDCCLAHSLWIAFKNLYLCSLKQPVSARLSFILCCELLSKTCIFALWNNSKGLQKIFNPVVNCFQKLVSLLFETTALSQHKPFNSLWIAFKNLYLCSLKQRSIFESAWENRCELLSKTCIFALWNNTICVTKRATTI